MRRPASAGQAAQQRCPFHQAQRMLQPDAFLRY
jgi:hypothetical protein